MKNLLCIIKTLLITTSLVCLVAMAAMATAQHLGTLQGVVSDPSGDVVVNAKIVITDKKGLEIKTKTNKSGVYTFNQLVAGSYKLRVDSKGFESFGSEEISIAKGQTRVFNISLKLKPIDEAVAIDADAASASEPNRNSPDIVLKEKEIENLPDDPDALEAALKALAPVGPGEPQIYVDGFMVQGPPPKESIREVRISLNYFSAEDDRPGGSRINIFTKIGSDKLRGSVFFSWSDEILNARNPFSAKRVPYGYKRYGASLGGTLIPSRASFFLDFQKRDEDQTRIVNARVLDPNLTISPLNTGALVPQREVSFSPRLDFQINDNHSLSLRYRYDETDDKNRGVGGISLPERGYNYNLLQNTFRLAETAVLNSQTVNETRFQYVRSEIKQEDISASPTLNVQGAFLSGAAGFGLFVYKTDRFELQNYTTTNTTNHLFRFGVRLRWANRLDNSPNNFKGTYTFAGGPAPKLNSNGQIVLDRMGKPLFVQLTSLESFRRTLLLQRQGFTANQIRARGGGASQFSIAQGDPKAEVSQFDVGAFFQDEWRLRPNFNLYLGLRYETQTNINDKANFAPRLAFAWVPKFGNNRSTTIRGGVGIYYERFGEENLIQALHFDGVRQKRFISSVPILLNLFPAIPSPQELLRFTGRQTITRIAEDIKAVRTFSSLIGFTHSLSSKTSFYAGLSTISSRHALRQRNINAPLPGTFVFRQSTSGIRPFGSIGDIFLIESSNRYFQNQFYAILNSRINSKVSLYVRYMLSQTKDGGDRNSFPADSNNLSGEYGRASRFSMLHRFYFRGAFTLPKLDLTISPSIVANSNRPFNIITGLDTNGDQIFMERPSFATRLDPSNPNVVQTRFGTFNVNPLPGEKSIPRNFGKGPSFLSINMGIRKTFQFGSDRVKNAGNSSKRLYKATFSLQIQNLLNRTNLDAPIGNLSSPFFGQSTSTVSSYGLFSSGDPSYNRRIEAQLRFNF